MKMCSECTAGHNEKSHLCQKCETKLNLELRPQKPPKILEKAEPRYTIERRRLA